MRTRELESLTNKLIKELEKDSDIKGLDNYHPKYDDYYKTYYSVTGFYKDKYFSIGITKSKNSEKIEIDKCVTDNLLDFKKYLKSKTDLKFKTV